MTTASFLMLRRPLDRIRGAGQQVVMVDRRQRAPTHQQWTRIIAVFAALLIAVMPVATSAQSDSRPYDSKLFRLSEILGGIHYLRELCGGGDGQTWRRHMRDLIDAEGTTALRRAVLARRFNLGYRNYSRTYKSCTVTAKAALDRFIRDAQAASSELLATRGEDESDDDAG